MTESFVPEPIFKVKKDTDLLNLYGPTDVDEVSNPEDDDELQSLRIKLAVLKAKENDNDEKVETIEILDADLEGIQELESQTRSGSEAFNGRMKRLSLGNATVATTALDDRIVSVLRAIVDCFSQIFEALVVKLGNDGCEGFTFDKRTKEFETRFHRLIFGAKQGLISLEALELKVRLGVFNGQRCAAFKKCLVRSLKSCHSLLLCYVHHLPFAGKLVFPPPLESVIAMVKSAVSLLKTSNVYADGSTIIDLASQVLVDVRRFSATVARFGSKPLCPEVGGATRKKFRDPSVPSPCEQKPSSCWTKKSNLKRAQMLREKVNRLNERKPQKEILPRSNKLLEARKERAVTMRKQDGDGGNPITPSNDKEEIFSHVTNENELKKLAFRAPGVSPRFAGKFLEIGDDEANDIMKIKDRNLTAETRFTASLGQVLRNSENPMLLVTAISERVVRDVVSGVCDEILSTDVVSELMQLEFGVAVDDSVRNPSTLL